MAVARGKMTRFSLRTLVLLSILGPPLLAILWFGGIYLWYAAPEPLGYLAQQLHQPGVLITLGLSCFSCLYFPRDTTERMKLPLKSALALWCFQFVVLWHWFIVTFGLLGWGLIWGDRYAPPLVWIALLAGIVAGLTAGITTLRNQWEMVTRNYYQNIFTLTLVLLLMAAPVWLAWLPRLVT
jgi:hypothetical protein